LKNEERKRTVSFSRTNENKMEEIAVHEQIQKTEEPEEKNEGKGKETVEDKGNETEDLENKMEEISLSSDAPVEKDQEKEEDKGESKKENENNEGNTLSHTNSVVIDNNGAESTENDEEKVKNYKKKKKKKK